MDKAVKEVNDRWVRAKYMNHKENECGALLSTQEPDSQLNISPDTSWGRIFGIKKSFVYNLVEDYYEFGRGPVHCKFTEDLMPTLLPCISKHHFSIFRENDAVIIKDCSAHGTYINGHLIGRNKSRILRNNDEISLINADMKIFIFYNCLENREIYPPELNEKYSITKEIGRGSYGEVYMAYIQGSLLATCAIKVMKKNLGASNNSGLQLNTISQINNEIQLLKSLSHHFIIKMLDFIESPDKIYIVMEYAQGGDLFDRIRNTARLAEYVSKFYTFQIASALAYLHAHRITHRDIKPENILLSTKEEFTCIKLTDFGLSKLALDVSQMTTFCGTLLYLAPELLKLSNYSKAVDVWSFGVVLYVCLSGYPPFSGTDLNLKYSILCGRYNFNHSVWSTVSDTCQILIKKILVVNPMSRPSITEILKDEWFKDSHLQEQVNTLKFLKQYSQSKRKYDEIEVY